MSDPILILQMQRMGDLILSFHLIVDLKQRFPNVPIWIVAEEIFFAPLMNLAPSVTFFAPNALPHLAHHHFSLIVNVSSRPEAANFLGLAQAAQKLGPCTTTSARSILGFWHLYRHALIQNNRHNTFHWADINRLDLASGITDIPRRGYSIQRRAPKATRRIGLVLGASQETKHPDLAFWTILARGLLREGYLPFFFGGTREQEMGTTIATRLGCPMASLCGKLPLTEVALWFQTLELCITPDTGPMHLADWLGVPVLNLSMGPVRAFDTGPYSEGQWVLSPKISCAGCWACDGKSHRCKKKFQATDVLKAAKARLQGLPCPSSHTLLAQESRRDHNLFTLRSAQTNAQTLLDALWRTLLLSLWSGVHETPDIPPLVAKLRTRYPALHARISAELTTQPKLRRIPALLPLQSFLETALQNDNFSRAAVARAREWIYHVRKALA